MELPQFRRNCRLLEVALADGRQDDIVAETVKFKTWIDWLEAGQGSRDHVDLFFATTVPRAVQGLLKRSVRDEDVDSVKNFLHALQRPLLERLRAGVGTLQEVDALASILDPTATFYLVHGRRANGEDSGQSEWLEHLGVGNDCEVRRPSGQWVSGRVSAVSPTNTEVLVAFTEEGLNGIEDWMSKEDTMLRPPGFSDAGCDKKGRDGDVCTDLDEADGPEMEPPYDVWRQDLQPGSMCDGRLKETGSWFRAAVVDSLPEGDGHDSLKLTLVGFPVEMDFWVSRGSRYIARLDSQSAGRTGPGSQAVVDTATIDALVNDADDPSNTVAVNRTELRLSSQLYVDGIISFHSNRGFETVLRRLSVSAAAATSVDSSSSNTPAREAKEIQSAVCCSKGNVAEGKATATVETSLQLRPSISLFRSLVECVARTVPYLTRAFATSYLPALRKAIEETLVHINDADVRQLNNGIVRDVLKGLSRLLRRTLPRYDAAKVVERLTLLLARKRLSSEMIEQRLNALDSLLECARRATAARNVPTGLKLVPAATDVVSGESSGVKMEWHRAEIALWLKCERLCEWIIHEHVLEGIFVGSKAHHALMRRTSRLVVLLVEFGRFSDDQFGLIWGALCRAATGTFDQESSTHLHALLSDLIPHFPAWILHRILDEIELLMNSSPKVVNAANGICGECDLPWVWASETQNLVVQIAKCRRCAGENGPSKLSAAARAVEMLWKSTQDSYSTKEGSELVFPSDLKTRYEACDRIHSVIRFETTLDNCLSATQPSVNTDGLVEEVGGVSQNGLLGSSGVAAVSSGVETSSQNNSDPSKSVAATSAAVHPGTSMTQTQAFQMMAILAAAQRSSQMVQQRLEDQAGVGLRQRLLERCVHNVTTSQSVPQSLRVMRQIIETYPITQPHQHIPEVMLRDWCSASRRAILYHLNRSPSPLLPALFSELRRLKELASAQMCASGLLELPEEHDPQSLGVVTDRDENSKCRRASFVLSGTTGNYEQQISARLSFLSFVCCRDSPLSLTTDQVETVWKELQVCAFTAHERSMCFRWLMGVSVAANTGATPALSPDVVEYVFTELLSNPDKWDLKALSPDEGSFYSMPLEGFRCLRSYFMRVNANAGRIQFQSQSARSLTSDMAITTADIGLGSFQVLSADLIGKDVLWRVALRCKSSAVASASVETLSALQQKLSPALMSEVIQLRTDFLKICLEHLRAASATLLHCTPGSSDDQSRLECIRTTSRCVSLLQSLLRESEVEQAGLALKLYENGDSRWTNLQPHRANSLGKRVQFWVCNNVSRGSMQGQKLGPLFLYERSPIWRLRAEVTRLVANADLCGRSVTHEGHNHSVEIEGDNDTLALSSDSIRLFACGTELGSRVNGKFICDFPLLAGVVTLIAARRKPQVAALGSDGPGDKQVLDGIGINHVPDAKSEEDKETKYRSTLFESLPAVIISSDSSTFNDFFTLIERAGSIARSSKAEKHAVLADRLVENLWRLLQSLPSWQAHTKRIDEVEHCAVSFLELKRIVHGNDCGMCDLDCGRATYSGESSSSAKRLYILQLIESRSLRHASSPILAGWPRSFQRLGGAKVLLNALLADGLDWAQKHNPTPPFCHSLNSCCAVVLMRLLLHFLLGSVATRHPTLRGQCALVARSVFSELAGLDPTTANIVIDTSVQEAAELGGGAENEAATESAPGNHLSDDDFALQSADAVELQGSCVSIMLCVFDLVSDARSNAEQSNWLIALLSCAVALWTSVTATVPDALCAFKAGFFANVGVSLIERGLFCTAYRNNAPMAELNSVEKRSRMIFRVGIERLCDLHEKLFDDTETAMHSLKHSLLDLLLRSLPVAPTNLPSDRGVSEAQKMTIDSVCTICNEVHASQLPHAAQCFLDSRLVFDEYFSLTQTLLELVTSGDNEGDFPIDPALLEALIYRLTEVVRNAPVIEGNSNDAAPFCIAHDTVLLGTLRLLKSAIGHAEPGLRRKFALGIQNGGFGLLDLVLKECICGQQAEERYGTRSFFEVCSKQDSQLTDSLLGLPDGPSAKGCRWPRLNLPKCKRPATVEAAFNVLDVLSGGIDQASICTTLELVDLMRNVYPLQKVSGISWASLGHARRAPSGFVGLTNLGCICFMNSLIQQIFMIPTLRYSILLARDPALLHEDLVAKDSASQSDNVNIAESPVEKCETVGKEKASTCKTQNICQRSQRLEQFERDSFVYNLQLMFAALELSSRRSFNPEWWCAAFKDESGRPTNVREQQDAQEFFQRLCDRLDEAFKNSPQDRLLHRLIGVTLANQLICLESDCSHDDSRSRSTPMIRESVSPSEYCMIIELPANGIEMSLHQALAKFVEGEELSDFKWEQQDGSWVARRTLKRSCISALSDTLVLHLKRFRLNWETFATEKNNSRFTFPLELDLFPYSQEGLKQSETNEMQPMDSNSALRRDPSYYKYRLAGVVVHAGATLNSGHYYSYIRAREGLHRGKWFEFNDEVVRPFDINSLDTEAFGGIQRQSRYNAVARKYVEEHVLRTNNAYMLWYERVNPLADEASIVRPGPPDRFANIPLNLKSTGLDLGSQDPETLDNACRLTCSVLQTRGLPLCASLARKIISARVHSRVQDDNTQYAISAILSSSSLGRFLETLSKRVTSGVIGATLTVESILPMIELLINLGLVVLPRSQSPQSFAPVVKALECLICRQIDTARAFLLTCSNQFYKHDMNLTLDRVVSNVQVSDAPINRACDKSLQTCFGSISAEIFAGLLLRANDEHAIQSTFAQFLANVTTYVYNYDPSKIRWEAPEGASLSSVVQLTKALLSPQLFNEAVYKLKHPSSGRYWWLLHQLALLGPHARSLLCSSRLRALLRMLDVCLGEHSPLLTGSKGVQWDASWGFGKAPPRPSLGDHETVFSDMQLPSDLVAAVALLVASSWPVLPTSFERDGATHIPLPPKSLMPGPNGMAQPLSRECSACLMQQKLYVMLLNLSTTSMPVANATGTIVAHLSHDFLDFSNSAVQVILNAFERVLTIRPAGEPVPCLFAVLERFLRVDDRYKTSRIVAFFTTGVMKEARVEAQSDTDRTFISLLMHYAPGASLLAAQCLEELFHLANRCDVSVQSTCMHVRALYSSVPHLLSRLQEVEDYLFDGEDECIARWIAWASTFLNDVVAQSGSATGAAGAAFAAGSRIFNRFSTRSSVSSSASSSASSTDVDEEED